jgi:hypothetical protein
MTRLTILCFLFASPTKATADPIPKEDRVAIKVEGTTWEGEDTLGTKWRCTFLPDGVLEYTTNGNTYRKASWKQDGKRLYWECNNRYAEYEGDLKRDEMKLDAHNVTGKSWTVTIRPAKNPPK